MSADAVTEEPSSPTSKRVRETPSSVASSIRSSAASLIGVMFPHILLPRRDRMEDMRKWPVIACDQYTSEEDYWARVEGYVGSHLSTLRLTFPEVYLDKGKDDVIIEGIAASMASYLAEGVFRTTATPGVVFLERTLRSGKVRKGFLLAIDLDSYDYKVGNTSLIRATEATIESRIPPRLAVRRKVPIELPHVILLMDDPNNTVLSHLEQHVSAESSEIYSTDLMEDSGHIRGYWIDHPKVLDELVENLMDLPSMKQCPESRLLFAVGDGNHSLATAKAWWTELKNILEPLENHPARYALVEIQNCQDPVIEFEPIHRLLVDLGEGGAKRLIADFEQWIIETGQGASDSNGLGAQSIGSSVIRYVVEGKEGVISIPHAQKVLPVATFTDFIDSWMKIERQTNPHFKIDYVHETTAIERLCTPGKSGNIGFAFEAMEKGDLFKSITKEGVLPRKTFSMGNSHEKRFYFEGRIIVNEGGE